MVTFKQLQLFGILNRPAYGQSAITSWTWFKGGTSEKWKTQVANEKRGPVNLRKLPVPLRPKNLIFQLPFSSCTLPHYSYQFVGNQPRLLLSSDNTTQSGSRSVHGGKVEKNGLWLCYTAPHLPHSSSAKLYTNKLQRRCFELQMIFN